MPTVKLVKAPPPFTQAMDGETGERFPVGVEIADVTDEAVQRVMKLDGFEFEVTDTTKPSPAATGGGS